MSTGPEFLEVEEPFITQLNKMGWRYTTGNLGDPSVTQRETFREVLLRDDLRKALRRINLDPGGEPWLDEHRIDQATHALERLGTAKLLEANQKATELLYKGTTVDGVEGWEKGRAQTVHFIDWRNPENNTFRAINQFRVACPAGQPKKHMDPDIVLFVNGIPLVVVECKSPGAPSAMEAAIDQLQRYANQRKAHGVVDFNEGSERLFHYGQFQIVTSGEEARVGTFSALADHYLEWKDTSPTPMAEVAAELGKDVKALTSQEKLVAGMLRPAHMLDIVRHFTSFAELGGRVVKIVARYQQFRAVQLAVHRLKTGKTRPEDGEQDRRGGIIWHTQGSGKSLTMVFLIRKMRSDPELRRFKVVVVTDRRDLEVQLSDTARMTGENLTIVKREQRGQRSVSSYDVLQETLARPGKDLVFATIQKYRGELIDSEDQESEDDEEESEDRRPAKTKPMPVLNEDTDILVLVDEAHRSHTNTAHANLMRALPNCAKIGFTGTPIIMGAKKRTHEIFGEFIDKYTIRQAEADEAIVPILYEGRTTGAEVKGGGKLDDLFEDMLADRSPEEMEAIKAKYATKGRVMEAKALIAAKARSMLRHYVENILPNGYKAQVVAVSRRATIRYYEAFKAAQAELVEELEGLDPSLRDLTEDQMERLEDEQAFLVRARRFLPTIRRLEFAPVISGTHNDTVDPHGKWTARAKIKARIKRFKKPLLHEDPEKADPLAFLIVKSMLLTGFDAPVEQAMYLDRHIKEAELLQAVARVNRTHTLGDVEKEHGIVIDYYGVAQHLKEALAAYSAEDAEGALQSLKDELPKLRDRHRRAVQVFTTRGIEDIDDVEACVELLRDERVRAQFHVALKDFLQTLDTVLPRKEGLEYTNDAKALSHIQMKAQKRYRSDERLIGKEVGAKVRKLIDDHVISKGIDPRIPPVTITDSEFEREVDKQGSPRAKASEMEHALRYHIRKHFDEDPTHFEKLSKRLENILQDLEGQWDKVAEALRELVEEARQGRQQDDTGLDPETQAPFYALLKQEVSGNGKVDEETKQDLCDLTVELVDHIRQEISIVGFWKRAQAQEALRGHIFMTLDDAEVLPFDRLDEVAGKVMELAKANHRRLRL
ncbi:MAG: type I restriction endonuclease subunit R [Myxococcota bacterium]